MQGLPPSTTPKAFDIPNPFGGRYKLIRKLGQGGMGVFYFAEDTPLGRQVARKFPRDLAGEGAEVIARFEREARALAGFSHPNICKIFDVGQIDGHHFLTMEYHEGQSLKEVLVRGRPMPPEEAVSIIRTLALAMQQAHDRGIVHRDLKPSNILLTTQKDLVILDFGLARPVDGEETLLTQTGQHLGTPAYMAPEQAKADPALIGPACDVYSLGVILYEMLCSRRPFNGPVQALSEMTVHDRPAPPSTFHPGLDPALEAACLKALEKDPADRHLSMSALATELSAWLASRTAPDGPTGESTESGGRRRFPIWLAAAAGALVVILGIVLLIVTDKRTVVVEKPPTPNPAPPPIAPKDTEAPPVPVVVPRAEVAKTAAPSPPALAEGTRAGEERDDNGLKLKLCWCPAGTFRMGSPDTEPDRDKDEDQVDATLTRGFWLGKYEVTQEQWKQVMSTSLAEQNGKSTFPGFLGEGPSHPMYHLNHMEAEEFCRKLTASERAAGRLAAGWEYRLPTEAEWEYACRAGGAGRFSFGDDPATLGDYAWFGENSGIQTHPVGSKRPNAFGLYDMHGNVWEWCRDGYDAKLAGGVDPVGPLEAPLRVCRGGGGGDAASNARSANRGAYGPGFRSCDLGFRVARVQVPSVLAEGTRAGEERNDNGLKLKLCWCPAGSFRMGSPPTEAGRQVDEEQVDVTLTRGFWLGKYEVTQGQWNRVMGTSLAEQNDKSDFSGKVGEGPSHPMYHVNHPEAVEFCRKLTASERAAGRLPAGWEYRLPTEAQWEYACRAGLATATAFGDTLSSVQANFDGNFPYNGASNGPFLKVTTPVGKYPSNRWGFHDMHGNVWEWCQDWYGEKLAAGVDPAGPLTGFGRVTRGGSWDFDGVYCRSADRSSCSPGIRDLKQGFRVATVPVQ